METDRGRGVFCAEDIVEGSVIEICPVIVIPKKDKSNIHNSVLHDFYFNWEDGAAAIALGFGSLYNHSEKPNADYEMRFDSDQILFKALFDIKSGQEICISYTSPEDPEVKLWFDPK